MDDRHKANGARLNRLLIDLGTEAMRNVFDSIHPPATLAARLTSYHSLLHGLSVINRDQMNTLFPPVPLAPSTSGDYDITLLYILFRNICGLHPPATTGSWNKLPPPADTTRVDDLARIKYYRNKIYGHITTTKVDDVKFNSYWSDISGALTRLGINVNRIHKIKTDPLEGNENKKLFYGAVLLPLLLLFVYAMFRSSRENVQSSSPLDFSSHLNISSKNFVGREWLFREIEEAINRSRTKFDIAILGDPGSGKSAIMSELISSPSSSPFIHNNIIGYHICKFDEKITRSGITFVRTLVEQLCWNIPEYYSVIKQPRIQNEINNLCEKDPVSCFDTIILEPMTTIKKYHQNTTKFILIDALDECTEKGEKTSQILTMVTNKMTKLPLWLKLIISSPNKTSFIAKLPTFKKIVINSTDQRNLKDILSYIDHIVVGNDRFKNESVIECVKSLIKQLNTTKEGNFLYFKTSLQYLNKGGVCEPEQIPRTLNSHYEFSFRHRFLNEGYEPFEQLFEVLLHLNTPPTIPELEAILKFKNSKYDIRRVVQEVSEVLDDRGGIIRFHHKLFADWWVIQAEENEYFRMIGEDFYSDWVNL